MPQEPSELLNRILRKLDDLVNAEKEETVRRLQNDINESIKKAGENFRLKFSMADQPTARSDIQ
jgi:hypothetical protein